MNPLGYEILQNGSSKPIHPIKSGSISTAAFVLCKYCGSAIRSMGGPMYNAVCLSCYDIYKLNNFIEGKENL